MLQYFHIISGIYVSEFLMTKIDQLIILKKHIEDLTLIWKFNNSLYYFINCLQIVQLERNVFSLFKAGKSSSK
jgi:hypothetical protein